MYFSELPDCIKYKILRGPKKVLESIVKKHNKELEQRGTKVDYIIYEQDGMSCLLIEKTQEEIVKEIKDWVKNNLHFLRSKYKDVVILSYILDHIELCQYVTDFEGYINLERVYPECFYNPKPKAKKYVFTNKGKIELPDIEDIKRLDILYILDKLGIKYKKLGSDTYALYENGKRTDGWRATTKENIVTDFSGKGRPDGNPFNFVKEYLGLNNKETLIWFKEELGL